MRGDGAPSVDCARSVNCARSVRGPRHAPLVPLSCPPLFPLSCPALFPSSCTAFFPLSCPAQAGHPVTRARRLKPKRRRAERPAITGSSAFADDDNRGTFLARGAFAVRGIPRSFRCHAPLSFRRHAPLSFRCHAPRRRASSNPCAAIEAEAVPCRKGRQLLDRPLSRTMTTEDMINSA
jgi:hypothetical protein